MLTVRGAQSQVINGRTMLRARMLILTIRPRQTGASEHRKEADKVILSWWGLF